LLLVLKEIATNEYISVVEKNAVTVGVRAQKEVESWGG